MITRAPLVGGEAFPALLVLARRVNDHAVPVEDDAEADPAAAEDLRGDRQRMPVVPVGEVAFVPLYLPHGPGPVGAPRLDRVVGPGPPGRGHVGTGLLVFEELVGVEQAGDYARRVEQPDVAVGAEEFLQLVEVAPQAGEFLGHIAAVGFDLYANVRPAYLYEGVASPLAGRAAGSKAWASTPPRFPITNIWPRSPCWSNKEKRDSSMRMSSIARKRN